MIGSGAKGRIADINVTPMADVIIVLLIIFMITIPTIGEGPVHNLPRAAHTRGQEEGPVVVSVAADTTVFVDGSRVADARELAKAVGRALQGSSRLVQVKADAELPYAEIARVLDMCRAAGAEEIAFIARPRPGI
jgi:biopolymer transport protein ExbD